METANKTAITIDATIHAPVDKVWELWNTAHHIAKWNNASADWHTPRAQNDLRQGGSFSYRMEAKDGSFGFDFGGVYDTVDKHREIAYTMGDGRKVQTSFVQDGNDTHITTTFDAENTNPIEMQRGGWQSILNNFKAYAENHG